MNKYGVKILGTGSFMPPKVLTNADLEKMVQTSDEWITTRTGIKERRIADEKTATSDLAIEAAKKALEEAKLKPEDIDMIIVATVTPDMSFPSTACFVQKGLGASRAAAFDLAAACSGFIYGISIAKNFIENGTYKHILLIGAETLSKITDWQDRNTCVLFGDGAGAMVLARTEGPSSLLSVYLGADGNYDKLLILPGGGSRNPVSKETMDNRLHFIKMAGKEVFKVAVTKMAEAAEKALEAAGKTPADLDLIIPHQANLRIIEAIAKRMDYPLEKVYVNLHKYGNVSAATTIVALDEARKEGRVKEGSLLELVAFGGGFTWGAAVIQL
ncbi:MAG TPA: 3-oxoacyl-ACP synthase [Elusimicrobia bacterium]|nr:MAG: 3-oxoacyl-ACP synthase [Elusimicrobia bacterium RIFOXYA12_FULL_49_49]OGS15987.1 MAG: 3-oxoacyl-ACP synthase [Elusimicrobia bacterium RIFOXYA2_FULL_47_53]OGS26333.1 MAG: 3-oxoacyl-ACP synthase [Elusimicrobia bacterium RIFOXYB12_FULL_50_12]OGS29155.1 MAG: 3-oxoacyl-ACP synthase [Elusimicrobia bacterium RIFOXYB2_FULL_46_23]HBU69374.1 3-oxoacyl-ACP synthase [Elusimicrobiota bacterium]